MNICKHKLLLLVILVFFQSEFCFSKIRLLTFHYNRPDFISYQKKLLDKFLIERDEYELIVFNDASDPTLSNLIERECKRNEIECVRFDQKQHEQSELIDAIEEWAQLPNITGLRELSILKGKHPSVRHCHVIQYALNNYAYNHDDIVGVIDGDMFLIRPFSIRRQFKNKDIIGTRKFDETFTHDFFWVALTLFNMKTLPNKETLKLSLTIINDKVTDSGGATYHYLKENPSVRFKKYEKKRVAEYETFNRNKLKKLGFSDEEIFLIKQMKFDAEFHLNNHFLHYVRSSFSKEFNPYAFENSDYHNKKTDPIFTFFNRILNQK